MREPTYDFIDKDTWSRAADFDFFIAADSQMHICSEIDVGPLRDCARTRNLKFYHCLAYLVARCINSIDDLMVSSIHYPTAGDSRVPIRYHRRDVSYPVLNAQGNPVNLCFEYDSSFAVFYQRSTEAAKKAARDEVNTFTETDAHFLLTYLPLHFTDVGMTSTKMRMQMPVVAIGAYRDEGERAMMPVGVTYPHAFADGMCLVRFYRMLEDFCQHPASVLEDGGPR